MSSLGAEARHELHPLGQETPPIPRRTATHRVWAYLPNQPPSSNLTEPCYQEQDHRQDHRGGCPVEGLVSRPLQHARSGSSAAQDECQRAQPGSSGGIPPERQGGRSLRRRP